MLIVDDHDDGGGKVGCNFDDDGDKTSIVDEFSLGFSLSGALRSHRAHRGAQRGACCSLLRVRWWWSWEGEPSWASHS